MLYPVIALVSSEVVEAIDAETQRRMALMDDQDPGSARLVREMCDANGWTIEALVAGSLVTAGLGGAS